MQFNGKLDATQVAPQQLGDKHPVGQFPARIVDTYSQKNKNTNGGQFCVEFETPAGKIVNRYNLWNDSPQAVEISMKELSALCHATGIFQLDMTAEDSKVHGAALRGGRCVIKVDLQDKAKPDGYVEIKHIYDQAGNEPGKAPVTTAQSGGGFGGQQQQPQQGGFGAPQQQANPQQNNAGGFGSNNGGPQWTAGQQAPQQQQPSQQQPQQNGGGATSPPWSRQ